MTDITNIRPDDTATVLPKTTDVRGETYTVTVRTVCLPSRDNGNGGVWTTEGRFVPAARIA